MTLTCLLGVLLHLSQPIDPPVSITPARSAERTDDLSTLAAWMTGSFSSAAQAAADPENYFDIRLNMAPIWPARGDAVWLYVEQAAAGRLDKPYRQRIYRVTQTGPNVFLSEVFTLPGDPLAFAGAYANPAMFASLTPDALTARDGCAMVLHRSQDGSYNGGTSGSGCASDLRGAAYATSQAHITAESLRTWDRGYDDQGAQVWGAEHGPYVFERVD